MQNTTRGNEITWKMSVKHFRIIGINAIFGRIRKIVTTERKKKIRLPYVYVVRKENTYLIQ